MVAQNCVFELEHCYPRLLLSYSDLEYARLRVHMQKRSNEHAQRRRWA